MKREKCGGRSEEFVRTLRLSKGLAAGWPLERFKVRTYIIWGQV